MNNVVIGGTTVWKGDKRMKTVGIIMLVLAVIILLLGIVSPINIFICAFIAAIFFLIGAIIIKRY